MIHDRKQDEQRRATAGVVVGTRPEVIKMAPVYARLLASERLKPVLLASGQHREMLDQALKVFGMVPDEDLKLMTPGQTAGTHGARPGANDVLPRVPVSGRPPRAG